MGLFEGAVAGVPRRVRTEEKGFFLLVSFPRSSQHKE